MNFVIVFLGLVVILLIFILWRFYSTPSTTIVSSSVSLTTAQSDYAMTTSPTTLRYALGMWVFVNSWSNTSKKYLMSIPGMMSVYLDANTPTLYVDMHLSNTIDKLTITDNFPLQRWTYITISCDVTYVDMYIDGKMIKSVLLPSTPTPPSKDKQVIHIGKDEDGNDSLSDIMISKFLRWTSPISPQDVWNQYYRGNGTSWLTTSKYGVDVNLTNNNSTSATFKLL